MLFLFKSEGLDSLTSKITAIPVQAKNPHGILVIKLLVFWNSSDPTFTFPKAEKEQYLGWLKTRFFAIQTQWTRVKDHGTRSILERDFTKVSSVLPSFPLFFWRGSNRPDNFGKLENVHYLFQEWNKLPSNIFWKEKGFGSVFWNQLSRNETIVE